MEKSSLRISNLEFKTCGKHLLDDDKHTTGYIAQWSDENTHKWVIASWNKSNDGFSLRFITDRPFDERVPVVNFWILAKFGQEYLSKHSDED